MWGPLPIHSADEINGLQELFRAIDADGSGTITVDELRTAIGQINGGRLQARACRPPGGFGVTALVGRIWLTVCLPASMAAPPTYTAPKHGAIRS